jgi:hypothetical protein
MLWIKSTSFSESNTSERKGGGGEQSQKPSVNTLQSSIEVCHIFFCSVNEFLLLFCQRVLAAHTLYAFVATFLQNGAKNNSASVSIEDAYSTE